LKPLQTWCDQYCRKNKLCEAAVEEGNPRSRLKNVMQVGLDEFTVAVGFDTINLLSQLVTDCTNWTSIIG
jgi:hypothetical protein